MREMRTLTLLAAGALALSGCAAKRLIKQGDASMLAGQPRQAVQYYRRALEKDPNLARKKEFLAKLDHAGSRAAYAEGNELGGKGKWEEALAKFHESLRLDPEFAPAKQAEARARVFPRLTAISLPETVEYMSKLVLLNTDTRVAYFQIK